MTVTHERPTEARPVASRGFHGLVSDLRLGARLAVGGGRASFIRLGLMAFAIGISVTLLLIGASIGRAADSRAVRFAATVPTTVSDVAIRAGIESGDPRLVQTRALATFEVHVTVLNSAGHQVQGADFAPLASKPPLPPGVSAFPAPGQLVVSPALADLLRSGAGAGLRPRLSGPIVGSISESGLSSPGELRFYRGAAVGGDLLTDQNRGISWGSPLGSFTSGGAVIGLFGQTTGISDLDLMVVVTGIAILTVPLLVFISIAGRIGGPARSRRLAAIRLIGGSIRQLRRFTIAEALLASVSGLLIGLVGFLIARLFAPNISVSGAGFFASDVRPDPRLAVAALIGVPVLVVMSVLVGQRRTIVEPLGVQRLGRPRPRRLLWRLGVVAAAGVALVVAVLLVSGDVYVDRQERAFALVPGITLAMISIPVVAPYLIERLARRATTGGTGWQLAVRRLQSDSGTAARLVSGLAVVLCAAVALLPLFAYTGARNGENTGSSAPARDGTGILVIASIPLRTIDRPRDAVASVPGVQQVTAVTLVSTDERTFGATIASCATIRVIASIDDCHDGDVVNVKDQRSDPPPRPGTQLVILTADGIHDASSPYPMRLPSTIRSVPVRHSASFNPGLYITPGALNGQARALLDMPFRIQVELSTANLDDAGFDRVRNSLAPYGWRVDDSQFGVGAGLTPLGALMATARTGLLLGGGLVLLVAVLSMMVLTIEQLTERRRPLTLAVAAGVPRSVLARSSIYVVLAPAVVAIVLADIVGVVVTLTFRAYLREVLNVQPLPLVGLSLATLAVIAMITAATLPALRRLTRPDALRTE